MGGPTEYVERHSRDRPSWRALSVQWLPVAGCRLPLPASTPQRHRIGIVYPRRIGRFAIDATTRSCRVTFAQPTTQVRRNMPASVRQDDGSGTLPAPKPCRNSPESPRNADKNARIHRIPARRANSLLKYSALWTQPCCRRPASPRRRRAIDAKRRKRDIEKRHGEDN
jgi:hypothetical protein